MRSILYCGVNNDIINDFGPNVRNLSNLEQGTVVQNPICTGVKFLNYILEGGRGWYSL